MNLKLVKLTREYRCRLTDMMSEWLAAERDFSPYVIRKNDYRDFDYYLENLETKQYGGRFVPDSVWFCLDADRNIFVGAVNIRHFLNDNLYPFGGHIGDGVRPSERRKGIATKMIGMALEKCRDLGIYRVLMTCDKDNVGSAKSIKNNGGVLVDELLNEDGVWEQCYRIDLTPVTDEMAAAFARHLLEITAPNGTEVRLVNGTDMVLKVKSMDELNRLNHVLELNDVFCCGTEEGKCVYECRIGETVLHRIIAEKA